MYAKMKFMKAKTETRRSKGRPGTNYRRKQSNKKERELIFYITIAHYVLSISSLNNWVKKKRNITISTTMQF